MILYFNKNGQLLERLEYGTQPRVGMTTFSIFAYFEGIDLSDYGAAIIRFKRPDLQGSEYPSLFMQRFNTFVYRASIEASNYFKEANNPYDGYRFNFATIHDDALNPNGIVQILDTPGMWEASITLINSGSGRNVTGLVRFSVGNAVSEADDDPTELNEYAIMNNLMGAVASKVDKTDSFYARVRDNFIEDIENNVKFLRSVFIVGSVVYDKTSKTFYEVQAVSEPVDENGDSDEEGAYVYITSWARYGLIGGGDEINTDIGSPTYYWRNAYFQRWIDKDGNEAWFENGKIYYATSGGWFAAVLENVDDLATQASSGEAAEGTVLTADGLGGMSWKPGIEVITDYNSIKISDLPRGKLFILQDNNYSYLCRVYKPGGPSYYFEFEEIGGDVTYRGSTSNADLTVHDIMTNSDYRKTYAYKDEVLLSVDIDTSTETLSWLYVDYGDRPLIINNTFLCKIYQAGGDMYSFEIESLTNKERWFGQSVSSSTTFEQAISNTYRDDYALKSEVMLSISINESTTTLNNLYATYGDRPLIVNDTYLCRIHKIASDVYVFEIEYLLGTGRWSASNISGSLTFSQAINDTYKANYALEKDVILCKTLNTETTTVSSLAGLPIIYNNTYLCCVNHIATNVNQFEIEDLTGVSRWTGICNDTVTLADVTIRGGSTWGASYALQKEAGYSLALSVDSSYVLSIALKNKDGTILSTQSVDLPLESIITSATYYDTYTYDGTTYTKVIVLVLSTTPVPTIVPVGDLVSGLVSTSDLSTALASYVLKTTTIAGIDLQDNITSQELTDALTYMNNTTDVDYVMED